MGLVVDIVVVRWAEVGRSESEWEAGCFREVVALGGRLRRCVLVLLFRRLRILFFFICAVFWSFFGRVVLVVSFG